MSRLQVHCPGSTPSAEGTTVYLSGVDVTTAICGVHLEMEIGQLVRARLDVLIRDTTDFDGQVSAYIPAETAELLALLGWTPPEGWEPSK